MYWWSFRHIKNIKITFFENSLSILKTRLLDKPISRDWGIYVIITTTTVIKGTSIPPPLVSNSWFAHVVEFRVPSLLCTFFKKVSVTFYDYQRNTITNVQIWTHECEDGDHDFPFLILRSTFIWTVTLCH